MAVTCQKDGTAALITIDNPPVNAIGLAERAQLLSALDAAAGAELIVITGAGRSFVAGADAREFDAPPQPPHLPDVLDRIEALPCVAAINGPALGGGLEIALACRARIAAPHAVLGLPEVTLGVVPGAGGTQRLPRLIGVSEAVAMIAEGASIKAAKAQELGLIDAVAGDPVAAALAADRAWLARPPLSALPPAAPAPEAISAARTRVAKRLPGQIAPPLAIDLVEAASQQPYAEAVARERDTFLSLRQGQQAAALRHLFFAERAALGQSRKLGGTPVAVAQAVVVGGGTMGAGIAYALAQRGIEVTLIETSPEAADRAQANVARLYDESVRRGKARAEQAASDMARLFRFVVGYDDLPAAQIAIEAAYESLEVKCAIFAALSAALPPETVLATNTSYLDVDQIAGAAADPSRVLGLHFFSPAHVMKLVEIIPAAATSQTALATAFALAERLGKIAVRAGICDGFIGNRILQRYRQICDTMLMDGALPWQIDSAMRAYGMAMGPYETQDLAGLDIAYANRQRQDFKLRQDIRYIPIADRMVEDLKRLGRKTSAGWYDYASGRAEPAPVVEALILDAAAQAGVRRRDFSPQDINERAIAAMAEEGQRILDEGIAQSASDIDLVLVHGYGFPRWRGGLMHDASIAGAARLQSRIAEYRQDDPLSWPLSA